METPEMNTNPNYKPVICPNCGSREIAFVTEYHKCIGARIICAITVIATIFITFMNFADSLKGMSSRIEIMPLTLFLLLISGAMYIGIIFAESKTHVQAICKDCGHLWLLD